MRLLAGACAAVGAVSFAGCGGGVQLPDLFIVQRSGSAAHARLTLLVNEEGGVRCNRARKLQLDDAQLLEARGIQEELHEPASSHLSLPARPGSVFSYYVRDAEGYVRFADNSQRQPKVLRELALFVLRVAQQVCRLPE